MNLNDLATEVTLDEGLKVQISVAQSKEILGVLGRRWRQLPPAEVLSELAAIVARAGHRRG